MSGQQVTISGKDSNFGGYLASPASGRGPGIVVIQEIFGVNQVMRDIADGLSSRGFFALVPDLFWRLQPGVELTDRTDTEWQQAFGLMQRFDVAKGVEDIQSAITFLRRTKGATGKVGALGYCLGGQLAYLTAARTDSDASVGYYGIRIQDQLEEAKTITHPLMLHIAEADEYTPPPAQKKIIAAFKPNPKVTIHTYAQMDHAFARVGGKHYDKANADLANVRSQTFFRQHLS
ncbi:MAG TPA: dienelactone hydrolase family protein [Rhizomicrobium sp.]|jgi:carboxymethylenebutenolidase|nr:dienelactone hydrolase family protein [Rhizomicrobium sp.]